MNMTRTEANEILERRTTIPGDGYTFEQINEAIDLALTALRGPTREMVERMFPGCPGCDSVTSKWEIKFCPFCGKPRTDEAVDMMLEKWRVLYD